MSELRILRKKYFCVFSKIKIKDNIMVDMLKLDFNDNFQSLDLGSNDSNVSNIKIRRDGSNSPPPAFRPKPQPNLDMVSNKDSNLGLELLMNKEKQRKSPSPSQGMSPPNMGLGSRSNTPSSIPKPSTGFMDFSGGSAPPKPEAPKVDFTPSKLDLGSGPDLDLDLDLDSGSMKADFGLLGGNKPSTPPPTTDLPGDSGGGLGGIFGSRPSPASTFTSEAPETPPVRKTFEQIQKEKAELIRKLDRFRKKGYFVYRHFDMNSELEDIKNEYENVKEEASLQRSLKRQKDVLITTSRLIEGACSTELVQEYTGKLELKGWSQHIMENIDDFEDVMEDLHDKYSKMFSDGQYPEARLLWQIMNSAIMFHITNKYVEQMPNFGSLLNENPALAKEFSKATVNSMSQNSPAFANMMGDMGGMEPRDMQAPSHLDEIMSKIAGGNMGGMGPPPGMNPGMDPNMGGLNLNL